MVIQLEKAVRLLSNKKIKKMERTEEENVSKMSVGNFVLSMVSVGVLFYVIGYGYYKGQESA